MEVKSGGQKIYFMKRDDLTEETLEEVEWDTWNLTRSKGELHSLEVTLTYPEDWIEKTSPSGLRCNIGDELHLYATFNVNNDDQEPWGTHRFGGYITSVKSTYDGGVKVTIVAKDYRLSLKNKQIFKDKYKAMPQTIGENAQYIHKMYSSTTLYDAIIYLCRLVNLTDTSELERPYGWVQPNNTPLTMSVGTASSCDTYSGFHSPSSSTSFTTSDFHRLNISSVDSEVSFTLYDDVTGYDAVAYPYLGLRYHRPKKETGVVGFKFTINGTDYYVPWFDNLSEYDTGGNLFIIGVEPVVTKKPAALIIPIKKMMDDYYPSTTYQITNIEVLTKKEKMGHIYLSDIAAIDPYQSLKMTHDYKNTDCLTIANDISADCGHYFDISPDKELLLYNLEHQISNRSIIEGENLIKSDNETDDNDYANNVIITANPTKKKSYLAQQIDLQGMLSHGEYDFVEEKSDLKTKNDVKKYATTQLNSKDTIVPTYTCSVLPDFGFKEGEVVYVYNPSLGVERSMEINTCKWTHDGTCELSLGSPPTTLSKMLINLDKNQKIGRDMGTHSLDEITNLQTTTITNTGSYISPRGKIVISGDDLVEAGVNMMDDTIIDATYGAFGTGGLGDPLWRDTNVTPTVDESGVRLDIVDSSSTGCSYIPIGIPYGVENGMELSKITVTYSWAGFDPGDIGDRISLDLTIYSQLDISNINNNQLAQIPIVTSLPATASGTQTWSADLTDPIGYTLDPIPYLDYYHFVLTVTPWSPETGKMIRIESIEVEYYASGASADV